MKAGLQIERVRNEVTRGDQAPTVQLFWDRALVTNDGRRVRGTYGYYNVTRNVITEGAIEANNVGLFVQDAWTVHPRLTLNLGLRAESEHAPSYQPDKPGVEFGFGDKLAPRLGFAWDVRGDARWKAYGSWGVFYDLMKLTIGRVMFGGERWMNYRFTLDTFDWPSIQCGYPPESGPNCPGTFIEAFDFRPVANDPNHPLVDPDLKAARSQEFTLGLDRELNRTMSLGVRYVHKWVDYAVEAICVPLPNGEDCGVNNPGFGEGEFPLGRSLPAQPAAERNYNGFEVRLRKRFADRWSADASYLLSHLTGNWSGLASSDEAVGGATGGLQLNSGRAFNLLYYSFDANGQPSNGLLATDRPHQFKGQVTYDTPWRMTIGANYLLESGTPQSTVADREGHELLPVRPRRSRTHAGLLTHGPARAAGGAARTHARWRPASISSTCSIRTPSRPSTRGRIATASTWTIRSSSRASIRKPWWPRRPASCVTRATAWPTAFRAAARSGCRSG